MRTWMMAAALAGMAGAAAAQEEQQRRSQDSEKKDGSQKEEMQKRPGQQEQGAELHAAWYDNWISGVHFRLGPQGRVFLMVPDEQAKGEFRTYEADSMQAFRRKHADVVRKHDLETLFGMSERQEQQQDDGQARRFQNQEELRRWVRSQEQALRPELRQWAKEGMERQDQADRSGQEEGDQERFGRRDPRAEQAERGGRSLGIVVAPVDPSLRAQLRLEEGQGFVVHRVEQDSLAEKSGLRKYDVIAEIKGRGVYDFQEFRSDLEDALSKGKAFELGVIRNGERRTVKVQPSPEGREAK